ncbi:MAG TPA: methyltransferase [Plantibacter sp.]|uniref:DUF7059 domain-containing protein n=1 Tax=unclassified Plantibacter TaxID=2624265 RepID=UPI002CE8AEF3|nr:methyltransferase [Plantibacter sp.]
MDQRLIDDLRSDLSAASYTVERVRGLWGETADAALHRSNRVVAVRELDARGRTTGEEPIATLARLFILGLPSDAEAASLALPSLGLDGAVALGLVTVAADGPVLPALDLRPYAWVDANGSGSWWIASDLGELALGHELGEQHVLGVGGASMTLSGIILPERIGSALDLGTGCGIQALHLSRIADRVVATDISERALELAALNAGINGVDTIEFRLGSMFEPVAGERFDRIVSNPPFVITPRLEGVPSYEYRDGGLVGDALVESVFRDAAAHLTEHGIAQFLGNWEYRYGADGLQRVAGWIAGSEEAVDAWVIEREVQDPAEYAETWIRDGGTRQGTPDFERLAAAWLEDFATRSVSGVGFGYVLLRRTDSVQPMRRLERLHGQAGSNASGLGAHLAMCLAAHDWHAALDDAALLRERVTIASDVTEERHYWPGDEDPTAMQLRQGGGLARSIGLDTGLAGLVGACDGELSLGVIIDAIAQLVEVDASGLRAELLPRVRDLLDDAILLPAN